MLIICLVVGLSVLVLLTGVISCIFIKRKNGHLSKEAARRLRKERKYQKKIERVEIMKNHHEQSDDSFVEYVDNDDIILDGDVSISNAPTVEYKKVISLENTIETKNSQSNNGSIEDKESQDIDFFGKNGSSSDDDSEESFGIYVIEASEMSRPRFFGGRCVEQNSVAMSSIAPSIQSEQTPYDEATSYTSGSHGESTIILTTDDDEVVKGSRQQTEV